MKQNNTILSSIGFSHYYITPKGKVYKAATDKEIRKGKTRRFSLIDDCGNKRQVSLKVLYKAAYGKEYCIDTIRNYPREKWKEIPNTDGKYFISDCGRVKSYCGYTAKILKPYKHRNGYLEVKIND